MAPAQNNGPLLNPSQRLETNKATDNHATTANQLGLRLSRAFIVPPHAGAPGVSHFVISVSLDGQHRTATEPTFGQPIRGVGVSRRIPPAPTPRERERSAMTVTPLIPECDGNERDRMVRRHGCWREAGSDASCPSQLAAPAHDAPVENKDHWEATVPTADEPFVTFAQRLS
jgi:hypothetical protein